MWFATYIRTAARPAVELRAATREMAAALNETRSRAIASNRITALVIAPSTTALPRPRGASTSCRRARQHRRLSAVLLDEDGSSDAIYFFPDGSSSGGEVDFAAGAAGEAVSDRLVHRSCQRRNAIFTPRGVEPAGFTLIEVLVAFAVAAIVLVPLLRIFTSGTGALTRSERAATAALWAADPARRARRRDCRSPPAPTRATTCPAVIIGSAPLRPTPTRRLSPLQPGAVLVPYAVTLTRQSWLRARPTARRDAPDPAAGAAAAGDSDDGARPKRASRSSSCSWRWRSWRCCRRCSWAGCA